VSQRENEVMAAVSQLATFARGFRQPAAPGTEIIETPRCRMQLIPAFPLPGPNSVSWIRCPPGEVDAMVAEVRATFGTRGLPHAWILDPDSEPPDLSERLRAHGIGPDPHGETSAVMILPAATVLEAPLPEGLEIRDGLESFESFRAVEGVAAEAFGGLPFGSPSPLDDTRRRRFDDNRAAGNRRSILATVHGEPAGSGALTLHPPGGAIMNGGAVRPKFRGLGVYRAMVVARLDLARSAGAAGLVVWGGDMSRPILERLGFETVSWRKFYM
jgi:GNAT superfamily N-acetyltransferase